MTKIVSTATVDENNGLVVLLHLDTADAYETLRTNFTEEVARGNNDGVVDDLLAQGVTFDIYEHDIDLRDVRAEVPDAAGAYRDVYNALKSHSCNSHSGVAYCLCGHWTSAEDHTYDDHLTRAVLTALGLPLPIQENP